MERLPEASWRGTGDVSSFPVITTVTPADSWASRRGIKSSACSHFEPVFAPHGVQIPACRSVSLILAGDHSRMCVDPGNQIHMGNR